MSEAPEFRVVNSTGRTVYCENCGARMKAGDTHYCEGPEKEKAGEAVKVDGVEIDYTGLAMLPGFQQKAFRLYLEHGFSPGQGLRYILEADLVAVVFCDLATVDALPLIFKWLVNHAPSVAWGSRARVEEWMRHRGGEYVEPADEGVRTVELRGIQPR